MNANKGEPDTHPSELITPEQQAWNDSVSQEWHEIYSRFEKDVEAMIAVAGGPDKVGIRSYGEGNYDQLCLHLNHEGGLLEGERDQEAIPTATIAG